MPSYGSYQNYIQRRSISSSGGCCCPTGPTGGAGVGTGFLHQDWRSWAMAWIPRNPTARNNRKSHHPGSNWSHSGEETMALVCDWRADTVDKIIGRNGNGVWEAFFYFSFFPSPQKGGKRSRLHF